MSDVLNVVVCKQGDAYRCSICGRGVSASAPGQEQIRRGALPVCNPCGFDLLARAEKDKRLGGLTVNPAAAERLEEMLREMRAERGRRE